MIFDCGLNFGAEHSQNKQYDPQHGIIVNNSTLGSIIKMATPGLQACNSIVSSDQEEQYCSQEKTHFKIHIYENVPNKKHS